MKIYQVVVTTNEIVDHDSDGNSVWEEVSELYGTYSDEAKACYAIAEMPQRFKRNPKIVMVEVA